jgi:hypothetical protein
VIAPAFDRLARTPWPAASLASSGINVKNARATDNATEYNRAFFPSTGI